MKFVSVPAVPDTTSEHRTVTALAPPHAADDKSTASCQSFRLSVSNEPVPSGRFFGKGELLHTVAPFTENTRLRMSLRVPCEIWTLA